MYSRTLPVATILALSFTFSGCTSYQYDDYEYARPHTLGPDEYTAENNKKKVRRVEKERVATINIRLPNLVVGRMNWTVEGGQAHFRFKVHNEGDAPVGAFSIVALMRSSTKPGAPPLRITQRNEEFIPAHTKQDVYMTVINETTFISDTIVIVDPPTETAPGGAIWESNETDNTDSERWSCDPKGCRVTQ